MCYGQMNNTYLTRDIIKCILNYVPQYQWKKLELNDKLSQVINSSLRPIIELCQQGDLVNLHPSIIKATSSRHYDVASACMYLLDSQVMPGDMRRKDHHHYYYSGHRWILQHNKSLDRWITNELKDLYHALLIGVNLVQNNTNLLCSIKALLGRLSKVGFVKCVIAQLLEFCYTGIKMDARKNLWGCHNGVIVVMGDRIYFRDGLPTDYITMSTNLNYDCNLTFNSPSVQKLEQILHQIFPLAELYDYVMKLFSSFLSSDRHRFVLFDDSVSSGKSTIIRLMQLVFGEYFVNEMTYRYHSNPERARILLLEKNTSTRLNKPCHVIQEEYEKPRFVLGWERFEVIPCSVGHQQNHSHDLERLAPAFIWLLVQHYTLFKRYGLRKPWCLVEYTSKYWNREPDWKSRGISDIYDYTGQL